MELLRTPEARFAHLPGYAFAPRYVQLGALRMHYVEVGPADAPPVLLLHGEPSWSYLYRRMLPLFAAAGLRAIAPDLVGFGRSDKPARREDYTYAQHVEWMAQFVAALDLRHVTLVCQDWGGLIGLRVAAEDEQRFARIVAANTFLPTGDVPPSRVFLRWQRLSQEAEDLDVGGIVQMGCARPLAEDVRAAYDAPFPDERYKAGARAFPLLVPTSPEDPAAPANRRAWEVLRRWQKPFLTAFGDSDLITRGGAAYFQREVPGAAGQPHVTLAKAGHFLQEDAGEDLARVVLAFVAAT